MHTKQRTPIRLHHGRLRLLCASAVQRMFPVLDGVSTRMKASISRARNGHQCPWYRCAEFLAELRSIGGTRAQAELGVRLLKGVVDMLWPAEEIDVDAAMLEEQRRQGRADVLQLRAMREPGVRLAFAEAEDDLLAAAEVLVAAIRREALVVGAA